MAELMYIKFLTRLSRQRILLHILFWMAVIVFCFFVFHTSRSPWRVLATTLGFLPGHMLFAYSLNYYLFPRFVLKGRGAGTVIGFLGILIICLLYLQVSDVYFIHYSRNKTIWNFWGYPRCIYALFSTGWVAVTLRLVRHWYHEKERQQQLEKEKLMVELQLLKSQLHPHFLFNTLNSLYAFSREKSDQAPLIVLKLSSLLRYILYECSAPLIPLGTEIDIIKSYLHLESMRFGERLDCSLQFTGDLDNKLIAPLILLPFVENSIKHGTSQRLETSWLSLHLNVEGNNLSFNLVNSRDDQQSPIGNAGGLGLGNVKKRLELLYPGTHTLKCTADEDTWQVNLNIRLTPAETTMAPHPKPKMPKAYATEMSYR
jgi:sensor histidine kinase YesM